VAITREKARGSREDFFRGGGADGINLEGGTSGPVLGERRHTACIILLRKKKHLQKSFGRELEEGGEKDGNELRGKGISQRYRGKKGKIGN